MEVLLPPRFGFAAHLIHLLGLLNLVSHKLGVFGGIKMPVKKMYQLGAWQPPSTPRLYVDPPLQLLLHIGPVHFSARSGQYGT